MLRRKSPAALILGIAAMALNGCEVILLADYVQKQEERAAREAASQSPSVLPTARPLRVSVTPASPPFVFRQGAQLTGLEVDFAHELANALGRPLELSELEWRDQIPTLMHGGTDLIMSGMAIMLEQPEQIAFTDPYLRSALIALVRRGELARYPDARSVLATGGAIGVVADTTGERFVRERGTTAQLAVYPTSAAAVTDLQQRRVDVVVQDAPVLLWFAAASEADVAPAPRPLNPESLAWGVRRSDEELRVAVNGVLARWREDGTRERILSRWVPDWSRLESEVGAQ